MIKVVIFDMFETLITHFHGSRAIYFGTQIAEDAGIPVEEFIPKWRASEPSRTRGYTTVEQVVKEMMEQYNCYSEARLNSIMDKRKSLARTALCADNLHSEILPMLMCLKEKGIKVGLISNCFSEEAEAIRESVLMPYIDVACLSCELHMKKPEEDIYHYCVDKLQLKVDECLYVGDGGSHELETAKKVGMLPVQAAWYLKEGTKQPVGRMEEFSPMDSPFDIIKYLEE